LALLAICAFIQIILTGSSSRKLRRGGLNLLAGRARLTRFYETGETRNDGSTEILFV